MQHHYIQELFDEANTIRVMENRQIVGCLYIAYRDYARDAVNRGKIHAAKRSIYLAKVARKKYISMRNILEDE